MIPDLRLAELSDDAYRHHTVEVADTQALVLLDGSAVVVAFRGTEFSFEDILRDIRSIPWHQKGLGWCHSGFLKGARAVWPLLLSPFVVEPDLPVTLTGHSLGGALATIIAAMMVLDGRPPAALVTFGSPRAGFGRLGKILKDVPTRRIVNGKDCIPGHPWSLWGFRHVGTGAIEIGGPKHRYADHRIADYIEAVKHQSVG